MLSIESCFRKTYRSAPFLLTLLLVYSFPAAAKNYSGDTVRTDKGLVSGTQNEAGDIRIFKGIPFAAPPVGSLRWKAPQPAAAWKGVRACTQFSASPVQPKPTPFLMYTQEFLIPAEPISEDCLYLNLWASKKPGAKRPVLVYIYGGGFSSGGSACDIYDGETMAKKGVVFVTINYRVGVLGFLAHPELSKESPSHTSGNYGLLDQIAALKWIQKNIAGFGGDPNNVTIAGQSAGSMSVNCLVASPLAKGLFHKAIAESGAFFVPSGVMRSSVYLKDAEQEGLKLGASIEELRKLSPEELLKKNAGFRPIVDGYLLPEAIPDIFTSAKNNRVALLTGWNRDEGFLFGAPSPAATYLKQTRERYGALADSVLQFYPATSEAEASASQLGLSRDMVFGVQNYTWANIHSAQGNPVFVYHFVRAMPAEGDLAKYGAFHTAEVPYAYGTIGKVHRPFQQADLLLSDQMSSYWANFARTGNPSGKNLPAWPRYNQQTHQIMILGEELKAVPLPEKTALDFLYRMMMATAKK